MGTDRTTEFVKITWAEYQHAQYFHALLLLNRMNEWKYIRGANNVGNNKDNKN